ncbi:Zinc-containing alcohol dehydrogenase [Chitinispirillum alkaliphilum]|nr:Zinc-containing alcohol dehydrogenase [Chitinispirillum alkaliphilum]
MEEENIPLSSEAPVLHCLSLCQRDLRVLNIRGVYMKAVVYYGVGDIRLEEIDDPQINSPTDALVRLTASGISGTDLHIVRGRMGTMLEGTVLGHEGVGIVEAVGAEVRNLVPGDRVVIPSSIACGYCVYCRAGYYSQCDNANPNGKLSGGAYFGGPQISGPFQGLQAQKATIPFANVGPVKIPPQISDDQAVMLSDILPSGFYAAELAEIRQGDTVAVFGCGPVGLFAIWSAWYFGAGRVLAVDSIPTRLEMARMQGAEIINFDQDDPVEIIHTLTGGIGVDRVIDAVGVDAHAAHSGPAAQQSQLHRKEFDDEIKQVQTGGQEVKSNWSVGDAPSQALRWETEAIDKAGTLAVVGLYPQSAQFFPFGVALNKNLTIKMGNCDHHRIIPQLASLIQTGVIDPLNILDQSVEKFDSVVDAYHNLDSGSRAKIEIVPGQ